MLDLAVEEEDEQHAQQQIDQAEADQRGQHLVRLDHCGEPVAGPKITPDDPRLAADFRREPAGLIGELWQQHGRHRRPQEPLRRTAFQLLQPSAPPQPPAPQGQPDQGQANPDHQMEALKGRLDRRAQIRGNIIQPGHHLVARASHQQAQPTWDRRTDGALVFHIHPAERMQRGSRAGLPDAFHCRQLRGLVFGHTASRAMPGDQRQQRGDDGQHDAEFQRRGGEIHMPPTQQIVGRHADDQKRAGLPSPDQGVRKPVH